MLSRESDRALSSRKDLQPPACISSGPCTRNLFLRRAGSLAVLWQSNCSSKMLVLVVDGSSYNVVAVVKEGNGNVSVSWRWGKMGGGLVLISTP